MSDVARSRRIYRALPKCDGAWIHEDVLVAMLQERASALVLLPWHERKQDRERNCAVCSKPLQPVSLGDVALDRCGEHGIWFDATELASLLKQAKEFKSDDVSALAKLFG